MGVGGIVGQLLTIESQGSCGEKTSEQVSTGLTGADGELIAFDSSIRWCECVLQVGLTRVA